MVSGARLLRKKLSDKKYKNGWHIILCQPFLLCFKKKLTINNFNIICKKTYNYYKKLENYNIKSKQKVIRKNIGEVV